MNASVRDHEAGHAQMCNELGVRVHSVTTIPDDHGNLGTTRHAPCPPDEQILIVLGGLIEHGDLPQWPISDYQTRDEQDLHHLIRTHRIGQEQYRQLILTALTAAAQPGYQHRRAHLATQLRHTPRIETSRTVNDPDLERRIGNILAHHAAREAERTPITHTTLGYEHTDKMHQALVSAFAKVQRQKDLDEGNVTIEVFEA